MRYVEVCAFSSLVLIHRAALAKPGERGPDTIFASYIIGFEFDKQLKDYAKQLKSMYCAVGDKRRNVRTSDARDTPDH